MAEGKVPAFLAPAQYPWLSTHSRFATWTKPKQVLQCERSVTL
jgi:hypothetical protein